MTDNKQEMQLPNNKLKDLKEAVKTQRKRIQIQEGRLHRKLMKTDPEYRDYVNHALDVEACLAGAAHGIAIAEFERDQKPTHSVVSNRTQEGEFHGSKKDCERFIERHGTKTNSLFVAEGIVP